MESVDECLPPTEKETSDRSVSGLLVQGDNRKRVSVLALREQIQTIRPLHKRQEENARARGAETQRQLGATFQDSDSNNVKAVPRHGRQGAVEPNSCSRNCQGEGRRGG